MTRRALLSLLPLSAWFLAAPAQVASPFLTSPYLQAVTPTSVYVLVESTLRDTVTVRYGPSAAYGSVAATESTGVTSESTFVHRVRLEGLTPNSTYHYRVCQGSSVSGDASFATAPLPGTPFRFAWMADCRGGVDVHDSIAARILQARPAVSIYGGDACRNPAYASWKREFFRVPELSLIARVPFYFAVGNHEGWSVNTRAFTHAPASASGTQEYYSVDYGDMHLLVLNTELPYDSASAQYAFARRDLAGTWRAWKVVVAHDHAYCGGGHGEDGDLKRMTANIFEPLGVDIVISGHSHFYQHNLVNGIHHLIIGSAGAPLYAPEARWYTVRSAKDHNYAIGDVTPEEFSLVVYNAGGAVLDSLVLTRGPALPVPGVR